MSLLKKYDAIIGLEIHAQLMTKTKAYSSEENVYGAIPNTKTSVISLAHPGTLPKTNEKVIEYAIKMGIAVGAKITKYNRYARKNYFYADLPKGYQITQDMTPLCTGGEIIITDKKGDKKGIKITRIHMEEDAGKSIHDIDPLHTLIDLNRAGVPLIEIVSEPEINSSEEAINYINQIKKLLQYLEICDGNMEEGSLRCDANISVKPKNTTKLGTKVEVKNMNSTRNIKKAIEFEINRQIDLLENNQEIKHETRNFDSSDNSTKSMRHKEKANDYRYFPEPDLQPIIISKEKINTIRKDLPALPNELFKKFTTEFKLSDYDANVLIDEKNIALYYKNICNYTKYYKTAANFVTGTIKSFLNENAISINKINVEPKQVANLIQMIKNNEVSYSIATTKIFPEMILNQKDAREIAVQNNWIQENNTNTLELYVKEIIAKYPDKVTEYKKGKTGLLGLFMGEIMKLSKGKADPKATSSLLKKILDKKS